MLHGRKKWDQLKGFLLKNGQITAESTYFQCSQGEGEEIINAPDPIGVNTLEVENLEVGNVFSENIKPWYFIQGDITNTDSMYYNIIPQVLLNNVYKCYAIVWESDTFKRVEFITINFDTQKIYDEDQEEISLDSASIQLINALNGDAVKQLEI